jgi:HEAT repeat protein
VGETPGSSVKAIDSDGTEGTILPLLLDNLDDRNPRARVLAIREISDYTDEIVIKRLLKLAEHDPELSVRCAAITGLGNFIYLGGVGDYDLETDQELACVYDCVADADFQRIYGFLFDVYEDPQRTLDEKRLAIESLSYFTDEAVEEAIADLYQRPEKGAQVSALRAMGYNGAVRWEETLRQELSNHDPEIQIEAITAAGELGLDTLGKDLWRLTYADEQDIALAAIWALGQTGWDGAFERLDELTLHEDARIRECADEAMEEWFFYNGLAQEHDATKMDRFLDEE